MSVVGNDKGKDQLQAIVPELYPNHRTLGTLESFTISAIAPAIAVLFTNPFDTAKVRLQLQGEQLKKATKGSLPVVYKGSFDCLYKILITEGVRGLQKGLTPAIFRESSKNGFRLGMYDPIMTVLHDSKLNNGKSPPPWKRVVVGSLCGAMGALSCNPFELVKTRLQSAANSKLSVGHQHNYTGTWDALTKISKNDGMIGLYRGSTISVIRSIVGSGSNLAAYSLTKEHLMVNHNWKDGTMLDVTAGLGSGIVSCIFMNPIDVVRTRFYNQPFENGIGVHYKSAMKCAVNMTKNEGPGAFYKGFLNHFLRIGPHFCLTFLFLGILRRTISTNYEKENIKDSFKKFDKDGNGTIDMNELEYVVKLTFPMSKVGGKEGLDDWEYNKLIGEYTNRILSKADLNHDNMISIDEYEQVIREIRQLRTEEPRISKPASFA